MLIPNPKPFPRERAEAKSHVGSIVYCRRSNNYISSHGGGSEQPLAEHSNDLCTWRAKTLWEKPIKLSKHLIFARLIEMCLTLVLATKHVINLWTFWRAAEIILKKWNIFFFLQPVAAVCESMSVEQKKNGPNIQSTVGLYLSPRIDAWIEQELCTDIHLLCGVDQ